MSADPVGLAYNSVTLFTVRSPSCFTSWIFALGHAGIFIVVLLLLRLFNDSCYSMAVIFSSLRGDPPLAGAAKPLDTAPVLIIENPLPSYHQLSLSELQLGSKSVLGIKFCPGRLKHIESIDAIFTDDNQVSSSFFVLYS